MTFKTLIKKLDDAYDGDEALMQVLENPKTDHGDGLARFIVNELGSALSDPVADLTPDQINEMWRMADTAAQQLDAVGLELQNLVSEAEDKAESIAITLIQASGSGEVGHG